MIFFVVAAAVVGVVGVVAVATARSLRVRNRNHRFANGASDVVVLFAVCVP